VALGAIDGPTGLRDLRHLHRPEPTLVPGQPLRDACLCGAVTVAFDADPGPLTACHCVQCRKTSGHVPRSFDDPERRARIEGEVATFQSPGGAIRSFCPTCGTKIAFDGPTRLLSLEAGLFDALAARGPDIHIFTAVKGDYYDLPPGAAAWAREGAGRPLNAQAVAPAARTGQRTPMDATYDPPQGPLKILHEDHELVFVDKPSASFPSPARASTLPTA
jgi:hypothetical protein